MSLLRWLGLSDDGTETALAGLEEIERALTEVGPARARHIACFAYILGRVARADHQITPDESAEMERLVIEHARLPASQASVVVKIASAHGIRHGGTEDFLVTREFARIANRDERLALLRCLLALSASDQSIVMLEDNEVRRIASELKLEHADFIEARAAHLRHLKVLRRPARPDNA
jgi:uncharacterized tellurite resistance protein B-like protein